MDDFNTIVLQNVRTALSEDLGHGDLTARLVPAEATADARLICRETAVLCGRPWFDETFGQVDGDVAIEWHAADGDTIGSGDSICRIRGSARSVLTAERTALNFLQTLSGTATTARQYADAVAGTDTRILDTRKTVPGLRLAQKYAVRHGGCDNHRMGLYDAILIKENHIRSAGSITAAVMAARAQGSAVPVEVEIEELSQLQEVLDAGLAARVDVVMLDNFSNEKMRHAVQLNRHHAQPVRLEASGNVSLQTIRAIAETGVDFISVGSLTKHVHAIDLSLLFESLS